MSEHFPHNSESNPEAIAHHEKAARTLHIARCCNLDATSCGVPDNGDYLNAGIVLNTVDFDQIKAQALRDAAAVYPVLTRDMVSRGSVRTWLEDRANAIERE